MAIDLSPEQLQLKDEKQTVGKSCKKSEILTGKVTVEVSWHQTENSHSDSLIWLSSTKHWDERRKAYLINKLT